MAYLIIGIVIFTALYIALYIHNNKNWWRFNKRFRRREK